MQKRIFMSRGSGDSCWVDVLVDIQYIFTELTGADGLCSIGAGSDSKISDQISIIKSKKSDQWLLQLGVEETGKFVKVRKTYRNFLAYRAESKLSAVRDSADPSGPVLFNKNVIRKITLLLMR